MWHEGQCGLVVTKDECREFAEDVADFFPEYHDEIEEIVAIVCYCFTAEECIIEFDFEFEIGF